MSQQQDGDHAFPYDDDDLERQLLEGVSSSASSTHPSQPDQADRSLLLSSTDDDAVEDKEISNDRFQNALALFAEAAQDMATAGVELGLGRHFACVDFCNQVAEKAAQAVSVLQFGHRAAYNHDLQELGSLVGAPEKIQQAMASLTPFHPEAFYAETPPEVADEVISADQANGYMLNARAVLNWARRIVLAND
jgi:HEPN domain-containing protein